jgi:hypothetical protein
MKKVGWAIGFLVIVVIFCAALQMASATALTGGRNTPQRIGPGNLGLTQGSNVIYQGSMVAVWSNGLVAAASDAASYKVVGCAMETVDNTGANYSATRVIEVRRGVFRWENGGSFTDADVGSLAYVSDDQTVTTAAAATHDIVAGIIVDVDTSGVWVDSYAVGGQGAASVTTWAASGNGSVGGTLAVSGNATVGGGLGVTGSVTGATVNATGNATVGGGLGVTGAITGATVAASSAWTGTITNGVAGITNTTTIVGGVITTNVVSN